MMQEISRVGLPWAGSVMIPHGLFDSLGSLSLHLPINISVYIFLYVYISVFIYLSSVCPVSIHIICAFSLLLGGWGGWLCGLWDLSSKNRN